MDIEHGALLFPKKWLGLALLPGPRTRFRAGGGAGKIFFVRVDTFLASGDMMVRGLPTRYAGVTALAKRPGSRKEGSGRIGKAARLARFPGYPDNRVPREGSR
jgi:hypothetical protein